MCTLAFLPLPSGGYLLGHNRDDLRARAKALAPAVTVRAGVTVAYPTDPDGGGTWIGANGAGLTVAILNAKEREGRVLPPVPRSRGLVLLDLLPVRSIAEAVETIRSIEPSLARVRSFHLAAAEPAGADAPARIARFRWNGTEGAWEESAGPCIFVSSSLADTGPERESSWRRFLERGRSMEDGALSAWLASHEPERGPRSVCMHRPEGGTMSRTLVEVGMDEVVMRYLPGPPCEPEGEATVVRIARACAPGSGDAASAPRGGSA
jgi:hypothetical protein